MAFMGYETPVEMPSMGIYNTDLMKMYIAGVKDQYEKGQEEMKDFMKLYGDFYSPIAGDTLRYNDMTVGGARDMINQMLANGIDPYKSPEARAAISRYINSVPTGVLNAMKQNAENRKAYDQAVAQARLAGKLDPEYEAWALKQAHLDNFSTIGPNGEIRTWDRLAPDPKQEWAAVAAPYLKEFDKTEKLDSDVKGYTKWGVSDANKKAGVDAVMNAANSTPWLLYKLLQAYDRTAGLTDEAGLPLSDDQRRALAVQDVRRQAEDTAAQYYQSKYEVDPYYKMDYEANKQKLVHAANKAVDHYYWTQLHPDLYDEKGKLRANATSKSKGGNNTKDVLYLPLNESTLKGINTITNNGKSSFGDVLTRRLKRALRKGKRMSADETLSMFATSNDKNQYYAWSGKKAYKDVQSRIYYDHGDEDNLWSGQEVLNFMNPELFFTQGKHGEGVRKTLSSIGDTADIEDTGDVIVVQGYDDGMLYSFRKVKTANNYMYEPTGYVYDSKGNMIADASLGAIQRDFHVGQTLYKGKKPNK